MFKAQQSVKKVMLTVFWDMKGPITSKFLEKSAYEKCFLLRTPLEKVHLSIE